MLIEIEGRHYLNSQWETLFDSEDGAVDRGAPVSVSFEHEHGMSYDDRSRLTITMSRERLLKILEDADDPTNPHEMFDVDAVVYADEFCAAAKGIIESRDRSK